MARSTTPDFPLDSSAIAISAPIWAMPRMISGSMFGSIGSN